jgi:hypothetical protein
MASKGKIRNRKEKVTKDLPFVSDEKIRTTFLLMLDKFNEKERKIVRDTYKDRDLLKTYEKIRNSGYFQKGVGKAHRRKLLEFPNKETWRFVDAVLSGMYGDDWLHNNKALKHELVRPFWVVKSI